MDFARRDPLVDFCKRVTSSAAFGRFIVVMIVLSGILVGIETYPAFGEGTTWGEIVQLLQSIVLGVFVIEIVMKIIACGSRPWDFFKAPWNIFDFAIVVVCLLPLNMQFASVFRMARILRTLRMVTALPRLQLLVSALLKAIPSLGYIGILLGLHFYIYAVMGTVLFRHNDPIRFGTLHASTLTLFQVLTLEGWNDVRDTQVMGSDMTYDDSWKEQVKLVKVERISQPQPVASAIYFISFILLGTMIMLNLFTGVIISSMEEAQEEASDKREDQLHKRGFLTLNEELALVSTQLQEMSEQLRKLQSRGGEVPLPSLPPPEEGKEQY